MKPILDFFGLGDRVDRQGRSHTERIAQEDPVVISIGLLVPPAPGSRTLPPAGDASAIVNTPCTMQTPQPSSNTYVSHPMLLLLA